MAIKKLNPLTIFPCTGKRLYKFYDKTKHFTLQPYSESISLYSTRVFRVYMLQHLLGCIFSSTLRNARSINFRMNLSFYFHVVIKNDRARVNDVYYFLNSGPHNLKTASNSNYTHRPETIEFLAQSRGLRLIAHFY